MFAHQLIAKNDKVVGIIYNFKYVNHLSTGFKGWYVKKRNLMELSRLQQRV